MKSFKLIGVVVIALLCALPSPVARAQDETPASPDVVISPPAVRKLIKDFYYVSVASWTDSGGELCSFVITKNHDGVVKMRMPLGCVKLDPEPVQ